MNQLEQDMVNDMQMAKENMDEAIRIYQTAQNRYYTYIVYSDKNGNEYIKEDN